MTLISFKLFFSPDRFPVFINAFVRGLPPARLEAVEEAVVLLGGALKVPEDLPLIAGIVELDAVAVSENDSIFDTKVLICSLFF